MKLLLRPKPKKYENLRGYILRLAQVNGYADIRPLLQLANLSSNQYYDNASAYVFKNKSLIHLSIITSIPLHVLNALRYGSDKEKNSLILGHKISNKHLRLDYPRICFQCLRSENIALAIWDLPAITACPIHKIELFDHCPECYLRLRWNRPGVNLCHNCDCDFRDYSSDKSPHEEYRLSRLIYQLSMNKNVNYRGIPTVLRDHSLAEVLDVVCSLAYLDYQLTPEFHETGIQLSIKTSVNTLLHTHFCNAMQLLDKWPDNFCKFLSTSRKLRRGRAASYGISKEIGAPFYHLKANRYKPIYEPLWQAYSDYRAIETKNTSTKLQQDRAKAEFVSMKAAAKELQIRTYQLELFIKRLNIKIRKSSGARKFILRNDMRYISELITNLRSMDETAVQLGCSIYQLRQLIRGNIITPFRGPTIDKTRDWLFEAKTVDDFQQQILKRSLTAGFRTSHQLDLNQTQHKLRYYRLSFRDLVQAILDGSIQPARAKRTTGFQDFKFSAPEIEALRGKPESATNYWQPPEIRNHLGCKRYIVFELMNSGHLPCEKINLPGRTRPVFACKIRQVKAFHNKYILLQEIASQLNVSKKKAKLLLFYEDIEPVSGPNIDNGHSWLYLRTQVTPTLLKLIKPNT